MRRVRPDAVQADVDEHVQALDAPEEPAADADWQAWLAQYDGIRAHLSALLRFEGRGIPSLDPPPSAALVDCDEARAEVILKAAGEAVDAALAQAKTAEAPRTRVEVASEALVRVKKFQDLLGEPLPEFGDNNATVLVRLAQQLESCISEEESA